MKPNTTDLLKGASQGLGVRAMLDELGVEAMVEIQTDASAAKGIALRRGLVKVRHIEVNQLWVQEEVAEGKLKIRKISSDVNVADHLMKYLNAEGIAKHLNSTGQWIEEGRHRLMPSIAE